MKVDLIVDAGRGFRWQDELASRLVAAGHAVAWRPVVDAPPWPGAIGLVMQVERLAHRYRGPGYAEPSSRRRRGDEAAAPASIVFDLSGRDGAAAGERALRPLYDGAGDPAAVVDALLDGRVPRLDLCLDGRIVASALPANERPDVLAAGLDFVFARLVDLCCSAAARQIGEPGAIEGGPAPDKAAATTAAGGLGPVTFVLAALAAKIGARLTRRLREPRAWRVGWRRQDGRSVQDGAPVARDGFAWLPDDGRRYFADPFLLARRGRLWAFCEEYPYATGKGVISVFEIAPDGSAGPSRIVLETAHHLSYPCVFEEAGEVWMIPESGAAGDVALYRAVDFPWRWRRERTLLDDVMVGDATPVRHDGRLWLFASLQGRTVSEGMSGRIAGSSWDALGLFHAPDLFGAFVPHPANPVLIDAGSSRPAGRFWRRGGDLMRVAQDCRAGYGAGLAICRVDRLDPEGFRQSPERFVRAPAGWGAAGLHTIDAAGGFEIVDCLRGRPG